LNPLVARPLQRAKVYAKALVALALSSVSCGVAAQTGGFDAANLRGVTVLDHGWLVHAGDDPAYARSDYDDSHWTPYNPASDNLRTLFPGAVPNVVWYRLHMQMAPGEKDLALYERSLAPAFEVYCNGQRILRVGQVVPFVPYDSQHRLIGEIPNHASSSGSIVLALRVRIDESAKSLQPKVGIESIDLQIGPEQSIREHRWYTVIGRNLALWLDLLVNLSFAAGALVLFGSQRNRDEYLWMTLWMVFALPSLVISVICVFHALPLKWLTVYSTIDDAANAYCMSRMYCAVVGHQIGWKLNFFLVVCVTGIMLGGIFNYQAMFSPSAWSWVTICYLPYTTLLLLVLPAIIARSSERIGRVWRFLVVPVLLNGIVMSVQFTLFALLYLPGYRAWAWKAYFAIFDFSVGPFHIEPRVAADILALSSLALIILIHSNRTSRREALLETEFANATEIQHVLLPEAIEAIPGFRLESAYLPARRVGGDFFQVLPVADGGMLIVVGDVAGKGLPAAMLVAVLVGAMRTVVRTTHDPSAVLAELNERLLGRTRGGFATALAAHFRANGTVTLANAGHLAPYLDGSEIEIAGSLPLGITRDVSYEEECLGLNAGSRIVFCSDGVAEARNKAGELFGFERLRVLSGASALQIANTARDFGQDDDITVLAVEFTGLTSVVETVTPLPYFAPA